MLCGFHRPDTGRIVVDGEEVSLRSVSHARSLGIDTVYQDLALVDELSVYHNMFLNREISRWPLLRNRTMKPLAAHHLREIGVNIPDVSVDVARALRRSAPGHRGRPLGVLRTEACCCSTSRSPPWAPRKAPRSST